MSWLRGRRDLTFGAILLILLGLAACARPGSPQSVDSTTQAEQGKVPFQNVGGKASRPDDSPVETDLPFQDPQNLPAGTLLTVRTKNSISVDNPDANGPFEAVVDQPVVIEGNRLVPQGAIVAGRVESARASNLKRNRGYVRLTLVSIQLAGSTVPVQTSSLFVRGNARLTQAPQSSIIRLEKGHRLVFRLTEPVYVAVSRSARPDR